MPPPTMEQFAALLEPYLLVIQRHDFTLSNAQLIALPVPTPVEVVAAPGANKIVLPVAIAARLTLITPYTQDAAPVDIKVKITLGGKTIVTDSTFLFDADGDIVVACGYPFMDDGPVIGAGATYINQPLLIEAGNDMGDSVLEGGNAGNQVKGSIFCAEID